MNGEPVLANMEALAELVAHPGRMRLAETDIPWLLGSLHVLDGDHWPMDGPSAAVPRSCASRPAASIVAPATRFLDAGRYLVLETKPRELEVLDTASSRVRLRLRCAAAGVTALVTSPDERYLVAGFLDGSIEGFELASGRPLARFTGGTSPIVQPCS